MAPGLFEVGLFDDGFFADGLRCGARGASAGSMLDGESCVAISRFGQMVKSPPQSGGTIGLCCYRSIITILSQFLPDSLDFYENPILLPRPEGLGNLRWINLALFPPANRRPTGSNLNDWFVHQTLPKP